MIHYLILAKRLSHRYTGISSCHGLRVGENGGGYQGILEGLLVMAQSSIFTPSCLELHTHTPMSTKPVTPK